MGYTELMPLLSPADQQKLTELFSEMTRNVRLLFFTQALGSESCLQTRQILDELPPLSDRITIEEANVVLDVDRAKAFGIDRAPGVAILYEEPALLEGAAPTVTDSRMRFLGPTAGYEFMSLIHAVLLAGGGASELTDQSRSALAAVQAPMTIQVFSTPT
mgnify:CR=1 FL=1